MLQQARGGLAECSGRHACSLRCVPRCHRPHACSPHAQQRRNHCNSTLRAAGSSVLSNASLCGLQSTGCSRINTAMFPATLVAPALATSGGGMAQCRASAALPAVTSSFRTNRLRRARRARIAAAAVDPPESRGKEDPDMDDMMRGEVSDDMLERIDAATAVIGQMIMEINKDVFVADPSGDLSPVDYAEVEEAAIQQAVDARIETLDESFLVTLAGFVRCAEQAGETKMHDRLLKIHQDILATVRERLPPEVQLLDRLISTPKSEERMKAVRKVLRDNDEESAHFVEPRRLEAAAAQFIEDMEDKAEVPDRQLLARMCLVREEVQNAAQEDAFSRGAQYRGPDSQAAASRGGVPRRAVAFLQAVMKVPSPEGRAAYLQKAFKSDWEGAVPVRSAPGTVSDGDEKSDAVRPGRFLAALDILQREMTKEGTTTEIDAAVLERIEDVRRLTFKVLQEMAD